MQIVFAQRKKRRKDDDEEILSANNWTYVSILAKLCLTERERERERE